MKRFLPFLFVLVLLSAFISLSGSVSAAPTAEEIRAANEAADAAAASYQKAIDAGYEPVKPASTNTAAPATNKDASSAKSATPATQNAAQSNNTFVPLQPGIPGIKEFAQSGSIPELLNNIYKICIGIAATLAVLQIMRAGVMYMGGDSITEKKEARNLISLSIVGLVLVLTPVIVFSIINPDILKLNIGIQKLDPVSGYDTDGFGAVNPEITAAQCKTYDQSKFKSYIPPGDNLGSFQTCSSKFGDGYVNVEPACCASGASGSVCCGFSQTVKDSGTTAPNYGTGNYSITIFEKDTTNNCSAELTNKYPSATTCNAAQASAVKNGSLIVKDCSGAQLNTNTARYKEYSQLPVCPN